MVGFPSGKSANGTSPELLFAVRDLSFSLAPGEVLGLVGESGSGKSVTSLAIMRLLPQQAQVGGEILLSDGGISRDLLKLPDEEMRGLRGSRMAMIFQEPMTALNSVMRVGDQIAEAVLAHQEPSKQVVGNFSVNAQREVVIDAD